MTLYALSCKNCRNISGRCYRTWNLRGRGVGWLGWLVDFGWDSLSFVKSTLKAEGFVLELGLMLHRRN